jgi:hypothetical protein
LSKSYRTLARSIDGWICFFLTMLIVVGDLWCYDLQGVVCLIAAR